MNIDKLDSYAKAHDLYWNEPASDEEVAALEERLQVQLPEEYKEFLRWHNGTDDREFCSTAESADDAEEFLDIASDSDSVETFMEEDYAAGRIGKGTFVRGWVPFYDYGTGAVDVIDCAPGPQGKHGQIVSYDPDGRMGVTHGSFSEWILDLDDAPLDDDEDIEFD